MAELFDLVVLGAGPGGYVAAIKAAQKGMKTAIVEAREVGGTCLNRGCVPTKALMHTAHLCEEIARGELFGLSIGEAGHDIARIYARKDEVVGGLRDGVSFLLDANKISRYNGKGTITAPDTVEVKTADGVEELKTKNILIATGSVPSRPPIPGLDLPGVITSDELLDGEAKDYRSMVIIGGGVIGVEIASIFHAFGCRVTIVEAMDRILPTMDKEISQNLSMILKKRGIEIFTGCKVEEVQKGGDGLICRFTGKKGEAQAEGEAVLVSIGRRPNIEGLFGDGVAPEVGRGLVVDENYRTTVPGIYAIGDVIQGTTGLAHGAEAQGSNVASILAGEEPEFDLAVVPGCVYTNPEIATVGIAAAEAKERGIAVKTGKFGMSANCKSSIEAHDRGFVKLLFDEESEVILGAQLMCGRATDLISELATAITNKLTIHQLGSVIRPHPTFSEAVTEAAEDAHGLAVHIAPKGR